MAKEIALVSKDGEHVIVVAEDDAIELNQRRAEGWATKAEQTAAAKAEAKAEKQAEAK